MKDLQRSFLADLAKPGIEERRYRHQQLAAQYGIPPAFMRALLVAWDAERLIAIRAWDGERLRPCREWKKHYDMFLADDGCIWLTILPAGIALVEGSTPTGSAST
ncbi:MAG: hypothetical protein WA830_05220 [Candidatus Sulfotelmatobacter sp.]